jgi:hypothetical protein
MEHYDYYKDTVEACSELRVTINEDLYKNGMNIVADLAENMMEKKQFHLIHRMNYYQGGYPSENSPPKLHVVLDAFINVIKFYDLLGKHDEVSDYLRENHITYELSEHSKNLPISFDAEQKAAAQAQWSKLFPTEKLEDFDKPKEFLEKLLGKSHEIQALICAAADTIKINHADKIKEKCSIKKGYFLKAVNTRAKKLVKEEQQKNARKVLEDILEDVENYTAATQLFEDELHPEGK